MAFKWPLVISLSIALGASATTSLSAPSDRWPMHQGGVDHSGYVPRTLLSERTSPRWVRQAQSGPILSLAVDAGRVLTTPDFAFSKHTPLVVQSLDNGDTSWFVDFGDVYSLNQPAVYGDYIYVQTSNGWPVAYLHCYRLDGQFAWRTSFESQSDRYLGPIVIDGSVYFSGGLDGGPDGGIYSVNAGDGKVRWFTPLPSYDAWSPTWADGRILVYTNALAIIDPVSGELLNTIPNPDEPGWVYGSVNQAVVAVGDYAYVAINGRLTAFDLQKMTIAWSHNLSANHQVATDGRQLFLIASGALTVRDPVSGGLHWSWVPSSLGTVMTNIIVSNSHVIVGDLTRTYLINRATHQVDKTLLVSGKLAYAADTLVIGTNTGFVYAFNLPSDELFVDGLD